jgi:hypothetical protein
MTSKAYQDDFEKSLSTLEDIQLLSEFSIAPLVSNAYFYLSEMKRKADAMATGQVASYDSVSSVLDEKLTSIVNDFFGDKSRFKEFHYSKNTKKIDLKKWDLILATIPELLSVVSLFNYHGAAEIHFDESRLSISGLILEDGKLELNRKFIYVVTRKLLRQKVLLTFKLERSAKAGLFKFTLRTDISHDDSLIYRVNFKINSKEQYLVGFSNIFCQYRSQLSDVVAVGEHNNIDIGSDLSVRHTFGIPELTRMESANKEILHFPFLFRPISIILPVKGSLVTDTFSRSLEDENKRKQDVSKYFRTIDFFSLFNF